MWYIVATVSIAIVFLITRYVGNLYHGNRLIKSIRFTVATPGSVEARFVEWLLAKPNRRQQKDIFIEFMMGLGLSEGWCVNSVVQCITHSWAVDGKPFGQLLVAEIDCYMTWDDPGTDPQKIEAQQRAKVALSQLKNKLLMIDS